jgi:hypothetical protein
MEPFYTTLPKDYQPQQNEFKFENITFSSKFDSGNLLSVERVDQYTVYIFFI